VAIDGVLIDLAPFTNAVRENLRQQMSMASPAFLTSVFEQIRDFDQIDELIVIESLRAVASDSVGGLTDDLGPDKPGVLVTLDLPEFMSAAEEEDLRRHLVTVVEQIS